MVVGGGGGLGGAWVGGPESPFYARSCFMVLDALLQPWVLVYERLPDVAFGKDGEVGHDVAPLLELCDDGVSQVGDEDGHCRDGDEAPYHEETAARVGLGREIA